MELPAINSRWRWGSDIVEVESVITSRAGQHVSFKIVDGISDRPLGRRYWNTIEDFTASTKPIDDDDTNLPEVGATVVPMWEQGVIGSGPGIFYPKCVKHIHDNSVTVLEFMGPCSLLGSVDAANYSTLTSPYRSIVVERQFVVTKVEQRRW